MDALLGALADGDIGMHFPDTDRRWKDANSLELLKEVAGRVRAKSFRIVNIDSTVLAEKPKIAPFIDRMRAGIADAAGITADRVSVKATTMEGMGTIGREEGIAAMAVVALERIGPGGSE
jgi:2-C-methyl-D-erythritol 2,4-cyclodiphosphate synthase